MIFNITLLVFKVLHGLTPSYLENLIRMKPEGRYHLRYKDQLLVPKTKCKTFEDRAFFTLGPVLWTVYLTILDKQLTYKSLRKNLKHFYLDLPINERQSVIYYINIQKMIFYILPRLINIYLIIYVSFQII